MKIAALMLTMPGREEWAAKARHMLLAQTIPVGLIEVGWDGPVGKKRNDGIERSQADIIVHWDDDDLYHPERVEQQVELLMANPEADIVGYHSMDFLDIESGERWVYRGRPGYAIGVSLCYRRKAWEERRFPEVNVGEDNEFQCGRRVATIDGGNMIVARTHSGNTSKRNPRQNPQQWELKG